MKFDRSKHVSFDVETSSKVNPEYALQPFRVLKDEAFVSSFAIADWDEKLQSEAHPTPNKLQLGNFLQHCLDHNLTIIAWNAPFDAAWLIAMGLEDLVMKCKWLDAMLLWKHLTVTPEYEKSAGKKKAYDLKSAVAEFYPQHAGYEEDIDFHSDDPEVVAKRLAYNKKDAIFTFMLAEKFYNELSENPARLRAALIEAQCVPMIAGTIVRGLNVDVKAAEDLYRMLDAEKFKHLDDLEPHGATPEILASPAQLSKLLFEDWGLPVIKTTAKGQPSTDKESLHELFTTIEDPRAESVRRYREAIGNQNKFADGTLDSVKYNGDGCTRPVARVFGTYTGRLTFASKQGKGKKAVPVGIPLHQMKGDKGGKLDKFFRKMIVPPPGCSIVEFDAAGQEFRWMAVESGDETMLQLCLPGEDPHSYMGSRIVQMDYKEFLAEVKSGKKKAKLDRNLGKFANLSFQYRISAKSATAKARVNYNLDVREPFIANVKSVYLSTYTEIQKYWTRQITKSVKQGYVETLAGRRVSLESERHRSSWAVESTAINYPIQGVGADQKYLACMCLKPLLTKFGGHLWFELHDGLYSVVPDEKVEQFAVEGKKILDNLPYTKAWGFTPPVPMPWDCKTGKRWSELKEFVG
jgi:DNA polymerase I-like protein with 3'-5' exonuclease and polymerase domains